ncbi:MAG: hypothetical protein JRI51_12245 [Deltaproteobacteria bacterium]|nr:hypothetical protein [Deltaproteobacteria bacterium]
MAQTVITWVIIGAASLFVLRWAYRKITGQAPQCCSNEGQATACSCCSQSERCSDFSDK